MVGTEQSRFVGEQVLKLGDSAGWISGHAAPSSKVLAALQNRGVVRAEQTSAVCQ